MASATSPESRYDLRLERSLARLFGALAQNPLRSAHGGTSAPGGSRAMPKGSGGA